MNSCSARRSQPAVASRPPLANRNTQAAKKATANSSSASYRMLASRRAKPGVFTPLFLFPGGGLRRREVLALARRQRLVFGPLLAQLAALLGRHLGDALVVLARLAALLGGQLGPGLHAPLHALLLLRGHPRVALRDADPLAPAVGLKAFPVRLERREGVLLLYGQLGPRRPAALDLGCLSPRRACSQAQREHKQRAAHYCSAARVFR